MQTYLVSISRQQNSDLLWFAWKAKGSSLQNQPEWLPALNMPGKAWLSQAVQETSPKSLAGLTQAQSRKAFLIFGAAKRKSFLLAGDSWKTSEAQPISQVEEHRQRGEI